MEGISQLTERALELLALPDDGVIGCGSGLSGETITQHGQQWLGLDISKDMLDIAMECEVDDDLILSDMGQGLGLQPGILDGAISISAVQWLCNADKSCHEPWLRLKAFFGSLYRCLGRGARAVLQVYPENIAQRELILGFSMRAGFSGGIVVDYPHRFVYLIGTYLEKGKTEQERQRKRLGSAEVRTDEEKRGIECLQIQNTQHGKERIAFDPSFIGTSSTLSVCE